MIFQEGEKYDGFRIDVTCRQQRRTAFLSQRYENL